MALPVQADNAGLEVLARLPRLETLYLNASTFDDEGFATLAKIKSLQSLALDHNQRFTGRRDRTRFSPSFSLIGV